MTLSQVISTNTLTTEIRDRVYLTSGRLPGEVELAARFAVNRHTLRRAVAALQSDGLVCIEPGRGIFVQHHLPDYTLSNRSRCSENLQRQGLLPSRQLLTARERLALGNRSTDILKLFGVQDFLRLQSRITTQMQSQEAARLLRQPVNTGDDA